MKKAHQTAHKKSIRTTVWLHFHAWTLGALAIISVFNAYSILHAPNDKSLRSTLSPKPLLAATQNSERTARAPANSPEAISPDESIAEIEMNCTADLVATLPPNVHAIRLTMSSCPNATYKIHNETNGFEGTVFRAPASLEGQTSNLSTDFMTLEKGRNRIRVVLNLPGKVPTEHWLSITRTHD